MTLVQVIERLKYRTEVHYCAYGGGLKKPTMLFSSFDLEQHEFISLACAGRDCLAKTRSGHVPWGTTTLAYRQSIPQQLSIQIGQAIARYIESTGTVYPACIRDT